MNKHKVFISYHHDNDQNYKEFLVGLNEQYDLFVDYSVRDGEIDDNKTAEQIRVQIRDEFIKDATVLILLCGKETRKRKHVDWEIHAAMFDTEKNPKMGMVVINLPSIYSNSSVRAVTKQEKHLISPYSSWTSLTTRIEYETSYPYMPARIIDSFMSGADISVVNWDTISSNPLVLKELVDIAFNRREEMSYDHSTPLRKNNS